MSSAKKVFFKNKNKKDVSSNDSIVQRPLSKKTRVVNRDKSDKIFGAKKNNAPIHTITNCDSLRQSVNDVVEKSKVEQTTSDNKFNWNKSSNIQDDKLFSNLSQEQTTFNSTTMLTDIIQTDRHNTEQNLTIKLVNTMVEHVKKGVMMEKTDIPCFYCRHTFDTPPIGIPVKWINSKCTSTQRSSYNVEETSSHVRVMPVHERIESDKSVKTNDGVTLNEYFEVDGILCSFNCAYAFLRSENPTESGLYKDSYMLLSMMYKKSVGRLPYKNEIIPSPHWRLLKTYGGKYTIEEYRKSFNQVRYTFTPNLLKPLGRIFEKLSY